MPRLVLRLSSYFLAVQLDCNYIEAEGCVVRHLICDFQDHLDTDICGRVILDIQFKVVILENGTTVVTKTQQEHPILVKHSEIYTEILVMLSGILENDS